MVLSLGDNYQYLTKDEVLHLCAQYYFAENQFQFLVKWNPTSLTHTVPYGFNILLLVWV